MWPTRAYSFRLVAIMGTTKISPHRSPRRLGGHRPARLPSHSSDGAGSHLDAGHVRRGARSARIFATRPPASRISSTFGGSALKRSTPPSGRWTSPFAMSTSITSPALTFRRNPGHSSTGSPRLIEFRKKIRANELARIADTPSVFSAIGACSRLDPHPKLSPATMRSPAWTPLAQAELTASKACAANTLGSVVPRYLPAIMWSVEISSPNVQTRPRKCRCIRREESGFGTINLVSLAGVDKPRDPSPAERSHTFRGSVISPWIADAVTVQGEARDTWACGDPIRPG